MIEPRRASIPSYLLLEEKIIIVRRANFLVLITSQVVVLMENFIGISLFISSLVIVTIWNQLAVLSYPLVCRIVDPDGLDALFSAVQRWSLLL